MMIHNRHRALHIFVPLIAGCLTLGGCIGDKKSVVPPPPTPQSASIETPDAPAADPILSAAQLEPSPASPRDAQPSLPMVFQLVCYQITVPVGTVSHNEAFWKRIDEQVISPDRYDVLRRNGMRLGVAPLSEFENIRTMLQNNSEPAKVMGTVGSDAKNLELTMRKDVPYQTISYFNDDNQYAGQNFPRSENLFNISFRRTPRTLGDMRLNITPIVRSVRTHLEYTALNNEIQISDVVPAKFYLKIEADLPSDKFLVLGASDTSELPTIIGHQFFIKDDPAQQMEQVLIFSSRPFRMNEPKEKTSDNVATASHP